MVKMPSKVQSVALAVDLVILTIREGALCVLTIERAEQPFLSRPALPGGFVRPDEDLGEAALRELEEETGLRAAFHLEQLQSYGAPRRDPRGRVVSVAYLALAPNLPLPTAGGDARSAQWSEVRSLPAMAFDHATILRDGVERARAKLEYTTLATAFCPERFTIPELRAVYETVWGTALDPANFYRKVIRSPGFVKPLKAFQQGRDGRPAKLYQRGGATHLPSPINRSET